MACVVRRGVVKPWVRVVERQRLLDGTIPVSGAFCRPEDPFRTPANGKGHSRYSTVTHEQGWAPGCTCGAPRTSATVFDPFVGSGTVAAVACVLGRHGVGLDLSYSYLHDIAVPRIAPTYTQPDLFHVPTVSQAVPVAPQLSLYNEEQLSS